MVHILVLEDDAKLNQTVCTYLNDSGFSAKGCLSANAAYDELYNHLYDVIVSDIMMPEVDGFEFAETVRVVQIIASNDNPDYKIPWLLLMLVVPVAGFMLYFLFYSRTLKKKFVRRINILQALFKQSFCNITIVGTEYRQSFFNDL